MPIALRCFLAFVFIALGGAAWAADIKPYAREDLASDVVRLTETLRKETAQIGAKIKGKSADQLRKDAAAAVADKKFKDASAFLGAAVSANPKDAGGWLALAKLGAQADDAQADGRYDMVARGQTAAYAAYSRATPPPPRPRRSPCSAISSRGRNPGAPPSTPIGRASTVATTRTRARSTRI